MLPSKFLQCQRCRKFILSETSTSKRIHNVKCLSSTLKDTKIAKQSNSEIFQGFAEVIFHPLTVNVKRLDNKEILLDQPNHPIGKPRVGRRKGKSSGGVDLRNIIEDSSRSRLSCLKAKAKFKKMNENEEEENENGEEENENAKISNIDRRRKNLRKKSETDKDPTVNVKNLRKITPTEKINGSVTNKGGKQSKYGKSLTHREKYLFRERNIRLEAIRATNKFHDHVCKGSNSNSFHEKGVKYSNSIVTCCEQCKYFVIKDYFEMHIAHFHTDGHSHNSCNCDLMNCKPIFRCQLETPPPIPRKKKYNKKLAKSQPTTERLKKKMSCPKCDKVINQVEMKRHLRRHDIRKDFTKHIVGNIQCVLCQNYYRNKYGLKIHFIAVHLEKTPFVCKFPGCTFKCGEYYHLERHVGNHVKGRRIKCLNCGKYIKKCDSFLKHKANCVTVVLENDDISTTSFKEATKRSGAALLRNKHDDVISNKSTQEDDPTGAKIKTETERIIQIESIHLFDKIIDTQEGPIHIKGECLQAFPEVATVEIENNNNSSNAFSSQIHFKQTAKINASTDFDDFEESDNEWDEGKIRETISKKLLSWNSKLKDTAYINSTIRDDPLFQKLEKENPEFTKMILPGGGRKNYFSTDKSKPKCLFRCDICSRAFRRSWALQNHKKQNVCHFLAQRISQQSENLDNTSGPVTETETSDGNNVTKDQELNFMCAGCGFESKSAKELELHFQDSPLHNKKIHKRVFPLSKNCGAAIATQQWLNEHINETHVKAGEFKCRKCDKAFANKNILVKHVYRNHQVHPCSKCGRKYNTKEARENHEIICKPEVTRPKCHQCGEHFCNLTSLKRHVLFVHANPKGTKKNASTLQNEPSNTENDTVTTASGSNKAAGETNGESVERGEDLNSMILGI